MICAVWFELVRLWGKKPSSEPNQSNDRKSFLGKEMDMKPR